jgi:hypothetical protein
MGGDYLGSFEEWIGWRVQKQTNLLAKAADEKLQHCM